MFSEELCTSAGPFTIVEHEPFIRMSIFECAYPSRIGDTCHLSWSSCGGDNLWVRIDLLDSLGGSAATIADSAPDVGGYRWAVNGVPGRYVVRFMRLSDSLTLECPTEILP